jgi:hypothetical protein
MRFNVEIPDYVIELINMAVTRKQSRGEFCK